MNINFDINILLCIQYTYVYVIYIWLWLIISTVYTYAGQSVSCIQAAQDHSMPLKSKGRRQHRNQPRVDATEHTPRLLGLKPRNHKRQDIVVNSDVSENYFVFFLKGREKRNGKRPWFVPKQRVFESKASSKGSYSWWTNIRWNVTSWRISIPTCIWYVYTIIYLSPTFHKGHLPGPTLKKWNWLHQRQGWDDRWSSRSSSVHRMFFKDSKFHQHFSPDNFIRFLTFWGDKRMFN